MFRLVPAHLRAHLHKIGIQKIMTSFREIRDIEWVTEFEQKYALGLGATC